MLRRISVMLSWVYLWCTASLSNISRLISQEHGKQNSEHFKNENFSSTFVNFIRYTKERFNLGMPDRISLMTSWVQLWRNASFFQILDVRSSRPLMSRIQATFGNENISPTFIDIANNMPGKFNLDMQGRISLISSRVQLWRNSIFVSSLTSHVSGPWWAEFMSLIRMKISHQLSKILSIICQKILT